ncbi:hypothetical protein G7085_14295 [Tessaracoccus sp. HDW20]|uniref:hypothetical protein n=1 Tax=Tessaracoccus coleopterorum TaxID=2714950 RepID=UPI0018D43613|nr:hypothetical protein [Tessaracoccus coleopterorum]NHB85394.1 hypothetical protein [Tessaracoccus coleopterorum]
MSFGGVGLADAVGLGDVLAVGLGDVLAVGLGDVLAVGLGDAVGLAVGPGPGTPVSAVAVGATIDSDMAAAATAKSNLRMVVGSS